MKQQNKNIYQTIASLVLSDVCWVDFVGVVGVPAACLHALESNC